MSVSESKLIEAIYQDKLRAAEKTSPGERLLDGPRLFDAAAEWTRAGIRAQNPGISEEDVQRIFRQRLEMVRRLENGT